MCLDIDTGDIKWSKPISDANQNFPRNTMASPSPVVVASGVYLAFGDGTIAKLTLQGQEIWKRNLVDEYGPLSF